MSLCPVCLKKIGIFAILFSNQCTTCSLSCHSSCSVSMPDYKTFSTEKVIKKLPFCKNCSEINAELFGRDRFCEKCSADCTLEGSAVCEKCGKFGHKSCYSENAIYINNYLHLIYPFRYNRKSHNFICESCKGTLDADTDKIFNVPDPVIESRDYIRGFKIVEEIKYIETDLFEYESDARKRLMVLAKQIGGNAVVNYWYDKHPESEVAGYSNNGNPYYKTVLYYSARGLVVNVKRKSQTVSK